MWCLMWWDEIYDDYYYNEADHYNSSIEPVHKNYTNIRNVYILCTNNKIL